MRSIILFVMLVAVAAGCNTTETATQLPHGATPKAIVDGDYPGKGKVTRINTTLGSVELAHEAIEGLMPAMKMEFSLSDKTMLEGLAVGDDVDFTIRHTKGAEKIVKISKRQ